MHIPCVLRIMAVRYSIDSINKASTRLAVCGKKPTIHITHFDGGACRIAAVGAGGAFSRDAGHGGGAEEGDKGGDLLEHLGALQYG